MFGKTKVLKDSKNFIVSEEFLYGIFDKVSGHFSDFFLAGSDALAVRHAFMSLVPIRDRTVYCFGSVVTSIPRHESVDSVQPVYSFSDVCDVDFSSVRLVDWKSYRLPETAADALAPLGVSAEEAASIARSAISEVNYAK